MLNEGISQVEVIDIQNRCRWNMSTYRLDCIRQLLHRMSNISKHGNQLNEGVVPPYLGLLDKALKNRKRAPRSNAKSISIGPLVTWVAPKKMMILMSSIAKMALVIKSGSGRSTYLFMRLFIPSFDRSKALVFCSIHDAAEIVNQKDTILEVLLKRQSISNTTFVSVLYFLERIRPGGSIS